MTFKHNSPKIIRDNNMYISILCLCISQSFPLKKFSCKISFKISIFKAKLPKKPGSHGLIFFKHGNCSFVTVILKLTGIWYCIITFTKNRDFKRALKTKHLSSSPEFGDLIFMFFQVINVSSTFYFFSDENLVNITQLRSFAKISDFFQDYVF